MAENRYKHGRHLDKGKLAANKARQATRTEVSAARHALRDALEEWREENAVKIAGLLEAIGQTATITPNRDGLGRMTLDIAAKGDEFKASYMAALDKRGQEFSGHPNDILGWLSTVANKLQLVASPGVSFKNCKVITGNYILNCHRFGAELPEQLRHEKDQSQEPQIGM